MADFAFPTVAAPKRVVISAMTGQFPVTLDASVSEKHGHNNDITEFPVETGGNVTDYVRPKSRLLTIEGVLSDYQLGSGKGNNASVAVSLQRGSGLIDSIRAGIQSFNPPIAGIGAFSIPFVPELPPKVDITKGTDGRNLNDAANQFYAQLETFSREATLLKVVTAFRSYENMVIEELDAPRDATTKRVVKFTIRLKEIRLVSSEVVAVKAAKISPKKLGKQTTPPATDAHQNKSWLVQGAQSDFVKEHPFLQSLIPGYDSFQSTAMNPLINETVH